MIDPASEHGAIRANFDKRALANSFEHLQLFQQRKQYLLFAEADHCLPVCLA